MSKVSLHTVTRDGRQMNANMKKRLEGKLRGKMISEMRDVKSLSSYG